MIVLNGQGSDVRPGESVAAVLRRLGLDTDARGAKKRDASQGGVEVRAAVTTPAASATPQAIPQ